MTEGIKPCPWCGKPPYVGPDPILDRYIRARCVNDGCRVMAQTIAVRTAEEAIVLWNRRAVEPAEVKGGVADATEAGRGNDGDGASAGQQDL